MVGCFEIFDKSLCTDEITGPTVPPTHSGRSRSKLRMLPPGATAAASSDTESSLGSPEEPPAQIITNLLLFNQCDHLPSPSSSSKLRDGIIIPGDRATFSRQDIIPGPGE